MLRSGKVKAKDQGLPVQPHSKGSINRCMCIQFEMDTIYSGLGIERTVK